MTINIPPRTITADITRRDVIVSDKNITPPIAAMIDTDNWRTAACIEDRLLSAIYHIV